MLMNGTERDVIKLLNEPEKQTPKKIKARWPVTVTVGDSLIEGVTRNITDAGMMILSKEPLRLDERYHITVRLPNYLDRVLTCKVIWSNLYGIDRENIIYGMGFCFVQACDKDRDLLNDLVSGYYR